MAWTLRKELFCQAYVLGDKIGNATEAGKFAGFSEKTAYSQGQRLLKDAEVKKRIKELEDQKLKRLKFTNDRMILELQRLATFDVRKLFKEDGSLKEPCELDDDTAAAVASIEIDYAKKYGKKEEGEEIQLGTKKIRTYDKNAALLNYLKHAGLIKEHHEVSGKNGKPMEFIIHWNPDEIEDDEATDKKTDPTG